MNRPSLDGEHPGHTYACFFPLPGAGDVTAGQPWAGGPDSARAADRAGGAGGFASARPGRESAWTRDPAEARPPRRQASTADQGAVLLQVSGLVKDYQLGRRLPGRTAPVVNAVAGVSLQIVAGHTFGLVGESGCGKTTLARLLAGLEKPDAGSIVFGGADLAALPARQRRRERGIQLMFQDSFASLDPRMRVRSILSEPLAIQHTVRSRGRRRQVARILDEVGLPPEAANRYPREFSGGQRQRLALARALIQRPALIVADEPVSALDVSVQAQILNLMRKLQRQYGISYLFISHDLSVIRYMADTIGVMYRGQIVEAGPAEDICTAPGHPYTAGLISAVPAVTGTVPAVTGAVPAVISAVPAVTGAPAGALGSSGGGDAGTADHAIEHDITAVLPGCRFRDRCAFARGICAEQSPPLRAAGAPGQVVACHFPLAGTDPRPDAAVVANPARS